MHLCREMSIFNGDISEHRVPDRFPVSGFPVSHRLRGRSNSQRDAGVAIHKYLTHDESEIDSRAVAG